ncbi:outer membrane protein assembly factor BamB family protein [Stratiformator vulcanicus]|uniref:Outer membrane biogenesis protein BamB n=1 Tax=Stratiformator vulcanicus TaxID=2527980 RepID=A0A517QXY8_9PLAN|nr:PQQ-binding-like beta-propeller repeat protein [Stratiformator vulcanicus]QDT36515.1 outer membrane biogenesis protein BamB [Stratiformator vulcanicus]
MGKQPHVLMNSRGLSSGAVIASILCIGLSTALATEWSGFRGGKTAPSSSDASPPIEWSDESGVAWKAKLPGEGFSGPIVTKDLVVVTGNSGYGNDRLHVVAFDRSTGEERWHRQFWATGRTTTHREMRVATPTPVTDGERIFAFYSSNDLIGLDLDGNLLWYRGLTYDFPNASNSLGMSSSPVLSDGVLIAQVENDAESFAVGVDPTDGTTRWKIDRPRKANWSSPLVIPGTAQTPELVILQSGDRVDAIEPKTGTTVWSLDSGASSISSAALVEDVVILPQSGLTAYRLAPDHRSVSELWQSSKLSPSTMSPVVYKDRVYIINRSGVLTCGNLETGKVEWQIRAGSSAWGTPVVASDRLYIPGKDGVVRVVDLSGSKGEIVAENDLGENIHSSPALGDDAIYFRTDSTLWKIAD